MSSFLLTLPGLKSISLSHQPPKDNINFSGISHKQFKLRILILFEPASIVKRFVSDFLTNDLSQVLVEDDDLAGDVIRRVCMVINVEPEPRMFLRIWSEKDGETEIAAGDVCANFIQYEFV